MAENKKLIISIEYFMIECTKLDRKEIPSIIQFEFFLLKNDEGEKSSFKNFAHIFITIFLCKF